MLGLNRVIAKDVKRVCLGHEHAQLGPPDKGRVINGLVIYYLVWLGSMIYGLLTISRCVVWSLFVVLIAIELKYRNKPEIHIGTYNI